MSPDAWSMSGSRRSTPARVRHGHSACASACPRRFWSGPAGDAVAPAGDLAVAAPSPRITDRDVAELRERCAFTDRPPLSARLPISYQYVPGWARALAASAIGRWNRRKVSRWAGFPGWPIDVSADVLNDLGESTPDGGLDGPTPVVLTHDIDSPEGLTNLLGRFVPLEEAVHAHSTSYVVPCAWPVDHGAGRRVDRTRSRGGRARIRPQQHDGVRGRRRTRAAAGCRAAVRRTLRRDRLSLAVAAADARAAEGPGHPLSVRQQHSRRQVVCFRCPTTGAQRSARSSSKGSSSCR